MSIDIKDLRHLFYKINLRNSGHERRRDRMEGFLKRKIQSIERQLDDRLDEPVLFNSRHAGA